MLETYDPYAPMPPYAQDDCMTVFDRFRHLDPEGHRGHRGRRVGQLHQSIAGSRIDGLKDQSRRSWIGPSPPWQIRAGKEGWNSPSRGFHPSGQPNPRAPPMPAAAKSSHKRTVIIVRTQHLAARPSGYRQSQRGPVRTLGPTARYP